MIEGGGAEAPRREIRRMELPQLTVAAIAGAPPVFEWVDPASLLVDQKYQRELSQRSITLIRRIVAAWDWRRFKPPVVARTEGGLEVIDGQHTAMAAASHPDITTIPVMLVEAAEMAQRAQAFIGHNRDRLGITPMQMHFAALAAGDPEASTLAQVCERAGVTVLKSTPAAGVFKPGDTVAVSGITALINRRGAMRARQVLEVLAKAHCAPVSAGGVKAVEMLLHDPEYVGQVEADAITSALLALGDAAEQQAKVFAAAHNVPVWKALGVTLFRKARRGRRRQD